MVDIIFSYMEVRYLLVGSLTLLFVMSTLNIWSGVCKSTANQGRLDEVVIEKLLKSSSTANSGERQATCEDWNTVEGRAVLSEEKVQSAL